MPKRLQKTMAQFRTSSHKLKIEMGRYEGITLAERTCTFCMNGEIDDEMHLLLKCRYHDFDRNAFLNSLPQHMYFITGNHRDQFHTLMSCEDKDIIYKLANFIHKCFIKRNGSER